MRRRLQALLLAFISLLVFPALSWGWGLEGHEIVAQIAQDRLGVNALREVRRLLGSESMADVASWADKYRLTYSFGGASDAYSIALPHYFVVLLSVVLPVIWLRRFLVERKKDLRNRCPTCGYDLRASKDRCPECGAAIVTPTS